ncbi:hypothetical protein lerEdw1_007194 [Lerista edwardsae]|nr:hypothetical protein lerEdw1_007194 [Lerista edwardsae]
MWQSIGLTLLAIVATLVCVLLFMLCGEYAHPKGQNSYTHKVTFSFGPSAGWYVVWHLFLSKFKFLRELIGDTGSQQGDNELAEPEAEQDATLTPQRSRQKLARQRRAPIEDAT